VDYQPAVLNGIIFKVVEKNENVVARCMLCKADKCEEKHISDSYKHTSNFRTHIKVSTYLLNMYLMHFYIT
jgi:hypothetical protein